MATSQARVPTAAALTAATVIVTRPAASTATLKRRIAALGGTPLALPGVAVAAAADAASARKALRDGARADVVVFVSPNAVRFAFALLPSLRFARSTQVCAVGRSTASALARHAVAAVAYPRDRQDSDGLLALPALQSVRGRRVALIGAAGGRDLLPATLLARGAELLSVHVYRRLAPRWQRRHVAALEAATGPLIVLLSSADALSHIGNALPRPLFAKLCAGECVVSSLRLAQQARAAGWARVHVAASALSDDLLHAAVNALSQHRL